MIFTYIKKNIQICANYLYYKDVVIDQHVVSEAIQFANALGRINDHYPDFFTGSARSAKKYAEMTLGHYSLNVVAGFGLFTFKSVLNEYTLSELTNSSSFLEEMGRRAWSVNIDMIWDSYPAEAIETAFNIPRPPMKKKNLRIKNSGLGLTSRYEDQSILIDTVLDRLISIIRLDIEDDTNRNESERMNIILKRIKVFTAIAGGYNMLHHQNTLHALHRKALKQLNTLNKS